MHDIKLIRDDPAAFDEGVKKRGLEPQSEALIELDDKRRAVIAQLQALQERRNAASKETGQAKAIKDEARALALMREVAEIKEVLAQMGLHLGMEVPNWPPENIDELAKKYESQHY